MFQERQTRNMFEAAFTTLALIYHQTVFNLRKTHANAVIGLMLTVVQALIMVFAFLAMYWIMGVKRSPLRGDFLIFIMSGIFIFMTHTGTAAAVAGAGSSTSGMMKHGPMNTAIMICAAALSVLYKQIFTILLVVGVYHLIKGQVEIEYPVAAFGVIILAWFSGAATGLVFLSIRAWWPSGGRIITMLYQRVNMVASGKMFVANALPGFLLHMFDWNPLFHMIDQMRGFVFVNYDPHHTSITYPIKFALTALMIGLMAEYVTRNSVSISWSAGR